MLKFAKIKSVKGKANNVTSDLGSSGSSSIDSGSFLPSATALIDRDIEETECKPKLSTQDRKTALKYSYLSNEKVRLLELVDYMHPDQIRDTLLQRLRNCDAKSVIALSTLFPRQTYKPLQRMHCVRCHRIFGPDDYNSDCQFRHPNSHVEKLFDKKNGAVFLCKLCNRTFELEKMKAYDERVNSYLGGYCFKGQHTSDPDQVDYGGPIKDCQESGCIQFFV